MHKRIATQEWTKPGVSTTSKTSTSTRGQYQYQQVPAHAHVIVPVPSGRSTCWTTKSFCCWNQIVSISKGILHVFFLSDCYQHQFLETQIQGWPVDILAGSIFWTILQFCYSLGCLGVIVQQISRVCDWLREVLKLSAVPASRLSHARWTTTVGWVCPKFWPKQLCPVFGQSLKECAEKHSLWGV